jgi:hypothetical protein
MRVLMALAVYLAAVLPHAAAALALGPAMHAAVGYEASHTGGHHLHGGDHHPMGTPAADPETSPVSDAPAHPVPCCGLWCAGLALVSPHLPGEDAPFAAFALTGASPFVSVTPAPDPPPPRGR